MRVLFLSEINPDPLVRARDALNEVLFRREALANGLTLYAGDGPGEVVAGFPGRFANPRYGSTRVFDFLKALVSLGLTSLTVDEVPPEEMEVCRTQFGTLFEFEVAGAE